MCRTVPVKILSIKDKFATVDVGDTRSALIDISLLEAKVGDYLIVSSGYGIRIVEEREALEAIKLWREMEEFYSHEK